MTVYMTKTWGFAVPSGALQFSLNGWRKRAREVLKPGDLVVIVGTLGKETHPDEQGRILGMMEPSRVPVSTLDYQFYRSPEDFDESGQYRWPYGLELVRAWRFADPRPKFSDLVPRRFGMAAAQGIVRLTDVEAQAVLAVPHVEIDLLQPAAVRSRLGEEGSASKKSAPIPTTTRKGIMHLRRAEAYTYAMEIEGAEEPAVKIGWAFDFRLRQRQFNLHSLPNLGGVRYRTALYRKWDTAMDAFRMEQWILRRFDSARYKGNYEVITPVSLAAVEEAWKEYLVTMSKPPVDGLRPGAFA